MGWCVKRLLSSLMTGIRSLEPTQWKDRPHCECIYPAAVAIATAILG